MSIIEKGDFSKMKSPAFQFYPAEFLADENVVMMSNQEIGCYIKLMCFCWREGSIPSDISKIAKLCGEESSVMAQLWLAISSCFVLAIDDALRLTHPRLEKERNKQIEHKKERSESGAKGANSRWNKDLNNNGSAIAKPKAKPIANDGSSSSSSTSSKDKRKSKEISLSEFLDECKANDEPAIREDDPIFEWAKTVSLPSDMLHLGWTEFKNIQAASKKQSDWRATFRNYVKKDYLKVWALNRDGDYYLTLRGKQLERELNGAPA